MTNEHPNMMIIFSNNAQSQTANLQFVHNGVYNAHGYVTTSSVESVAAAAESLKISVSGGKLMIEAVDACTLTVNRLDGVSFPVQLHVGYNTVELPRGVYVVKGKKVLL